MKTQKYWKLGGFQGLDEALEEWRDDERHDHYGVSFDSAAEAANWLQSHWGSARYVYESLNGIGFQEVEPFMDCVAGTNIRRDAFALYPCTGGVIVFIDGEIYCTRDKHSSLVREDVTHVILEEEEIEEFYVNEIGYQLDMDVYWKKAFDGTHSYWDPAFLRAIGNPREYKTLPAMASGDKIPEEYEFQQLMKLSGLRIPKNYQGFPWDKVSYDMFYSNPDFLRNLKTKEGLKKFLFLVEKVEIFTQHDVEFVMAVVGDSSLGLKILKEGMKMYNGNNTSSMSFVLRIGTSSFKLMSRIIRDPNIPYNEKAYLLTGLSRLTEEEGEGIKTISKLREAILEIGHITSDQEMLDLGRKYRLPPERFEKFLNVVEGYTPRVSQKDERLKINPIKKGDLEISLMEAGDPEGLLLGEATFCCQSFDGAGQTCAFHGFTKPNGGFYVVREGSRIIAQSWVWIHQDWNGDFLILDTIECPLGVIHKPDLLHDILDLFKEVARIKKGIFTKVVVGVGNSHSKMIDAISDRSVRDIEKITINSGGVYTDTVGGVYTLEEEEE